jgi:Mg/Co/Ni transporter MgtE
MASRQQNSLRTIHSALAQDDALNVLGRLSTKDLKVLSEHLKAGTLMENLTPLADSTDHAHTINQMPADIGRVLKKLPAKHVATLANDLSSLPRDQKNNLVCGC